MEITNTHQPRSMLVLALHKLLNITPSSNDILHVWTQQGLLNICLGPREKSGKRRSKVQGLLERLVKKELMHSAKICTDNEKCEVVIYWIPHSPPKGKSSEGDVQEMDVDQKQITERAVPRTPEPPVKRISLGPKTTSQSMASIISKTRAKFSGSTPISTPTGKRTPLSSLSKKSRRQSFKSPLVQDEDANNENLIKIWRKASQEAAEFLFSKLPKQSSFLESGGYSEFWGNSNWGWGDSNESKSKQGDENSDREDHEDEYETRRGSTEQKDTMKYMLTRMGVDVDLIKWNEDDECFEE
ncbi:11826_t:CDS:2 [Acaulospora colombiana]|uniref:11826_t:CDS:1 n=1 Tax=Acaulospora colombiana TaxID=27376 RepID=A0ACA9LKA6_9GLOM|nr:11826_t:CDS:2 [Acaulospora colombiana]